MALSLFLIALAAPAAARPLDDLLWDLQLVPLDGPAPPLALPALDGPPVAPVHARVLIALATSVPSRAIRNTVGVPVTRQARRAAPVESRSTREVTFFSRTQAATVSRSSARFTARTVRPRGPSSRWTCSIVEGNSLVQ